MDTGLYLWIWLLGAPLVAAIIDRMAIGKASQTSERYGSGHVRAPA